MEVEQTDNLRVVASTLSLQRYIPAYNTRRLGWGTNPSNRSYIDKLSIGSTKI